jgi:AcrR family transcriptional regulator
VTNTRSRAPVAPRSRSILGVAEELRTALRVKRQEVVQLFAKDFHPTASSILDVGADVIMSGGGGALTMRAVAKRANLKLASLQYHFQTFDDLVSALFLREFGFVADVVWNVLERLESESITSVEALRKAAESFMPEENSKHNSRHRIYFHLMAFCSYNADAFVKAKAFYSFYNTGVAYLISRVNPSLTVAESLARAILITSTLEGTGVYTILKAGGNAAERTVHREIGALAVHYAALPGAAAFST